MADGDENSEGSVLDIADTFSDVRRFVAGRVAGIFRTGLGVASATEDLEGNLALGRFDTVAFLARRVIYTALSLKSATVCGSMSQRGDDPAFYDVFGGVDPVLVERALRLASPPLDPSAEAYAAWVEEIKEFVGVVQTDVGIDLPAIRTAEGMMPALAVARDWLTFGTQLGVSPAPFMG